MSTESLNFDSRFETDTVLLRPLISDDYNNFRPHTSSKEMWTYFTSDLSIDSSLKNWVETGIEQIKKNTRLALTIIDKKSNTAIGSTSIGNISAIDKRAEIGWTWIAKEFQGTGVNNQIKYLLLKYCFEKLNFERVEFKTDVLNLPARKALTKIGCFEEGILRSHTLMINNRRRDTIYYSILKSEWENVKQKNNWI